jgi:hypothetical protein
LKVFAYNCLHSGLCTLLGWLPRLPQTHCKYLLYKKIRMYF